MPDFNYLTTHVGSVPHTVTGDLPVRLGGLLDIPSWTQHPRRTFRENMYSQFTHGLPGVVINEEAEKVIVDTSSDLTEALETFYNNYLADDLDAFALQPEFAEGFFAMLGALQTGSIGTVSGWAKGQVTGPISFGLTVTDQNLRAILYDDLMLDPIIKNTAMIARWQVRQLKSACENVLIFLDEPYLASFGSAFISLSREQVIAYLDEIFDSIHNESALTGVHCCANTDWGLLLSTHVDMLNLDAYGFVQNLALYPQELREFLDRGGSICWGIIPNNEQVSGETPAKLTARLRQGIALVCEKAAGRGIRIQPEELAARSLIAPACGLGSTSVDIAEQVFSVLAETGEILKRG